MSEPSRTSKGKKVVKAATPAAPADGAGKAGRAGKTGPVWTPTPEAKSKATTLRIVAWVLWGVAIALEVVTIIWILPKASTKLWLLLVMLVPIAIAAIVANLSWKQANRLDPASKANATKFFIQNQLGAFMTVLAFLPLIVLVLLDKNMSGTQKAIAGGIGAVVMLGAAATGVSWDGGPSQEQYAGEQNIMVKLTGEDKVFWVKGGDVFHVCAAVPDVNKESKDGTITEGTVAQAHAAGKSRLTLRWESEATGYCGYSQAQVDAVKAQLPADQGGSAAPSSDAQGAATTELVASSTGGN